MSDKDTWDNAGDLKPGLLRSRKDCKYRLENMFFKLSSYGFVSSCSNDRKY